MLSFGPLQPQRRPLDIVVPFNPLVIHKKVVVMRWWEPGPLKTMIAYIDSAVLKCSCLGTARVPWHRYTGLCNVCIQEEVTCCCWEDVWWK